MLVLILALVAPPLAAQAPADSAKSREHQIKAAFSYNFIKFVDWPKEEMADSNEPITIGIIGPKDFIKAFEPVIHKKIRGRNISMKYFAGYEKLKRSQEPDDRQWDKKMETLKSCQLLMFCRRDSKRIENSSQIIKALKGSPILTIGEEGDFLKSGGVINFVTEGKRVRFEINVAAAKENKLKVSSKLLRLAKKVVGKKSPQQARIQVR